MKIVEPIRDLDDIERIKYYLKSKNERDYVLFMFGIYTGLRVSDIIPIKVGQVLGDKVEIREKKTGKLRRFPLNQKLKSALKQYIKNRGFKDYDYLFPSRNRKNGYGIEINHISRAQAYKVLKQAGEYCGINNIGTHSMRKTFGYHMYRQTKNIGLLMNIFNHSSSDITLRYIGYNQDELDKALLEFSY